MNTSLQSTGDAPPIEADEKFSGNHESLVGMLTQQLGVYEREEHALRVLMEEEVKEKLHSHQAKGIGMMGSLSSTLIIRTSEYREQCILSFVPFFGGRKCISTVGK